MSLEGIKKDLGVSAYKDLIDVALYKKAMLEKNETVKDVGSDKSGERKTPRLVDNMERLKKKRRKKTLESIKKDLGVSAYKDLIDIALYKKAMIEKEKMKNVQGPKSDDSVITKVEDGSRFSKVKKGFFRKHMKKIIAVGVGLGIVGSLALVYQLLKQGDVDSAQSVLETAGNTVSNNVDSSFIPQDNMDSSFLSQDNVGSIDTTYYTNDDAMSGINPLVPDSDYHQNNLMYAVDSNNGTYEVKNVQDVINLHNNGVDVTSLQVGDENGIDGHVTQINGESLENIFNKYSK